MAWIESHQTLATHRKTMILESLLGIETPQAIGHLHLFWWWALDNSPDGMLDGIPDGVIERAAQWRGEQGVFLAAMIEAGFIDGDTRTIHGWDEYAGKLISQRISNREKQQRHRERIRNRNITVTSPSRNGATVPNSTIQNRNTIKRTSNDISSTTTNQTTREDEKNEPVVLLDIFDLWRGNIGDVSPIMADKIKDACEYFSEDWVRDAVEEAVKHEGRNFAYVETILRRWKKEGRGNGSHRQNNQGTGHGQDYTGGEYGSVVKS